MLGLAALAGLASASVALANMRGWYAVLTPPPLAPPNPLPATAWAMLAVVYVSMALAAWQVFRRAHPLTQQRSAINAWGWQLAFSAAWPAVFFGFHALLAGLLVAVLLVAGIALTVKRLLRLDAIAGILLAPNFAWASYELYLNAGFWWWNH